MDIKKATELTENNATYLIYGGQGVGKTTSLKYLPGKTLIIDIDKSSRVLKGEENIDVATIDTSNIWEEWNDTAKELITNKEYQEKYDNIVIDNISELFRSSLENLGKQGNPAQKGVPAMNDYQRVDYMIMRAIRGLKSLDVRLVITAWEKTDKYEHESGQTFNRSFPDLRHSISENFMGLCDVIARLVVVNRDNEQFRGFVLQPTPEVTAKNRLDDRTGVKVSELIV